MSEMIERVARALEPKCQAFGRGDMPMQVAREFAKAAIEAMREPTEAMEDAGTIYMESCSEFVWQAMIDAALSDSPAAP